MDAYYLSWCDFAFDGTLKSKNWLILFWFSGCSKTLKLVTVLYMFTWCVPLLGHQRDSLLAVDWLILLTHLLCMWTLIDWFYWLTCCACGLFFFSRWLLPASTAGGRWGVRGNQRHQEIVRLHFLCFQKGGRETAWWCSNLRVSLTVIVGKPFQMFSAVLPDTKWTSRKFGHTFALSFKWHQTFFSFIWSVQKEYVGFLFVFNQYFSTADCFENLCSSSVLLYIRRP